LKIDPRAVNPAPARMAALAMVAAVRRRVAIVFIRKGPFRSGG
jgi:hypothetical protein